MSLNKIQTLKGRAFDLLEPDPSKLDIEEIAHSLSLICRFNGHVRRFMSVAQHSVVVARLIEAMGDGEHRNSRVAYDGLMHDATEAYVGDMAQPLKALLPEYKRIENSIADAIAKRFQVSNPMPDLVKIADGVSLLWERRDLMAPPLHPWQEDHLLDLVPSETLRPWEPHEARDIFLGHFYRLAPRAVSLGED